ncbi:MAG: TolC family protein [Gemmatimonadaceae bacterium]
MFHIALALLLLQGTAPSADSLSLDAALQRARARRPEVIVARARIDEARAGRQLVSRPPNPTLEVSTVAADETRRLGVVQPLAPLVRLASERGSASALIDAARADSVQRLANLQRDVTRAFYGALAGAIRVRLLQDLVRLADSLGALAARRAQAGDISELDREQFVLEGARARLQLSRALEERTSRDAVLARQIAWDGGTLPAPHGRLDTFLAAVEPSTSPDVVPEVQRARAAARAAALSESAARWARIPVPGLLFQRDWSRVPGIATLTRLGFSVPVPLFSQGNEALGVAAARAREAQAQATEVELEMARQLTAGRARVAESARRARLAADTLLVGVVRLREGAIRLYDAGRTSVLQVLEALRAERDAQLASVDELLAFQEARADFQALAGRTSLPPAR